MVNLFVVGRYIIAGFFVFYLLVGLCIYRDYGISYDEHSSRGYGEMSWRYLTKGDKTLLTYSGRRYGVGIELPLYVLEKVFGIRDTSSVYYFRHLVTFLFFYSSIIVFYLTLRSRYGRGLAFLGSLFLILHPRIFSNSFYNSKDIGLLSAYIFGFAVLTIFLKRTNFKWAFLFGTVTAWIITVRVFGLFLLPITLIILWVKLYSNKSADLYQKYVKMVLVYLFTTVVFTVVLWPYLWSNPIANFIDIVGTMSKFPEGGRVLYLGEFIESANIPWHYSIVWMLITTPIPYVLLFVFGVLAFISGLVKKGLKGLDIKRVEVIFVLWFFLPLLATVVLRSSLYDSWRHLYFLAPAFTGLGIAGLATFINYLKNKKLNSKLSATVVFILIIISLAIPLWSTIKYHPYQNLYFNYLVGGMANAKKNFDLDYWGLTFREGLTYIAKKDKSVYIPVRIIHGSANIPEILPKSDRERFEVVGTVDTAKYVLTNYRYHPEEYSFPEIYSLMIEGVSVMTVYKVR